MFSDHFMIFLGFRLSVALSLSLIWCLSNRKCLLFYQRWIVKFIGKRRIASHGLGDFRPKKLAKTKTKNRRRKWLGLSLILAKKTLSNPSNYALPTKWLLYRLHATVWASQNAEAHMDTCVCVRRVRLFLKINVFLIVLSLGSRANSIMPIF